MSTRTRTFEANARGHDFVVGDVHGHIDTLERLLEAVAFDAGADRLFSVGDLVNRGPRSEDALAWIEERFAGVTEGNHERWIVKQLRDGARADALDPDEAWMANIAPADRPRWIAALEALPIAITVETAHGPVGIVHADAPTKRWSMALALFEQSSSFDRIALFGFDEGESTRAQRREEPMREVRALVHGHLPTKEIDLAGNRYGIDTGAGSNPHGRLTLMGISGEGLATTTLPTHRGVTG